MKHTKIVFETIKGTDLGAYNNMKSKGHKVVWVGEGLICFSKKIIIS